LVWRGTKITHEPNGHDDHICSAAGLVSVLSSTGVAMVAPILVTQGFNDQFAGVPGGGISPDGTRWISCRPNYVLPVPVLRRLFRRLFLDYLEQAFDVGELQFFCSLEPPACW
jgi:hypothetical protein